MVLFHINKHLKMTSTSPVENLPGEVSGNWSNFGDLEDEIHV